MSDPGKWPIEHRKFAGLLWAIGWLVAAVVVYWIVIPEGIENPSYAYQSPRTFPELITATIGVLSVVLFALEWFDALPRRPEPFSWWFFVPPILAGVYAVGFDLVGFPVTTAAVLAVLLRVFGERRILVVGGISVGTAALIQIVFVYVFKIPLPWGWLA